MWRKGELLYNDGCSCDYCRGYRAGIAMMGEPVEGAKAQPSEPIPSKPVSQQREEPLKVADEAHVPSLDRKRAYCLAPYQMFRLDLACRPIREAFGPPYLVGSVIDNPDFFDVDVRLILDDDEYDRMVPTNEVRTMLSMAFTAYLREASGLPVDFGIQRMTEANAAHPNKERNPLGLRDLDNWKGDAALRQAPTEVDQEGEENE